MPSRSAIFARGLRLIAAYAAQKKSMPPELVCPEGIEPPTPSLEGWCSIRLSYGQTAKTRILGAGLNRAAARPVNDVVRTALNKNVPGLRGVLERFVCKLEDADGRVGLRPSQNGK